MSAVASVGGTGAFVTNFPVIFANPLELVVDVVLESVSERAGEMEGKCP